LLNDTFAKDFRYFPDIHMSQSSVAMRLRCGGIFNDSFITRLLLSPKVKESWKSVNIWQSHGQEYRVSCFLYIVLAGDKHTVAQPNEPKIHQYTLLNLAPVEIISSTR